MFKISVCLFLVLVLVGLSTQDLEEDINEQINNSNGTEKSLSRKRRYLVFPTGSSLQLVYCLTVPSVGMGQIFTLGHTAALAWELPDKAEFILNLKNKKYVDKTTEEPETTTLPHLHLDYDYSHDYGQGFGNGYGVGLDYNDPVQYEKSDGYAPLERFDKPSEYSSGYWSRQHKKRPEAVHSRKTHFNPFFISKSPSALSGYSPVRIAPSSGTNIGYQRISVNEKGSRRKSSGNRIKSAVQSSNKYNRYNNENKPVTTYVHPVYHQHYRRTRRDLYGKIENLFTALSKDGKSCLMKAICEVSQIAQRKGTFMEEIIKAIFRVKPHDNYPDEDEYDTAANKSHNCTEQYPTCDGSIWTNMLSY